MGVKLRFTTNTSVYFPGRLYFPGDVISGNLEVECDSVLLTRSINVSIFYTENYKHKTTKLTAHYGATPTIGARTHTTLNSRTIFSRGKTLLGAAWGQREKAPILQVPPGKHSFPFAFSLPKETETGGLLPPSCSIIWGDGTDTVDVEFSCRVKGFVDISPTDRPLSSLLPSFIVPDALLQETTAPWFLRIGGHSFSSSVLSKGFWTPVGPVTNFKTFLLQKGKLSASVILSRRAIFTPPTLPSVPSTVPTPSPSPSPFSKFNKSLKVTISVENDSPQSVSHLSIYLSRRMMIAETGADCTSTWTLLKKVQLGLGAATQNNSVTPGEGGKGGGGVQKKRVEFDVWIPRNLVPSTEGRLVRIIYSIKVEFHVDSLLATNLSVSAPITVVNQGGPSLLLDLLTKGPVTSSSRPALPLASSSSSAAKQTPKAVAATKGTTATKTKTTTTTTPTPTTVKSSVVDFQLENGTYTGELLNGKPSGKGEMNFKNGDLFCGTWTDGSPVDGTYCFDESKLEFEEEKLAISKKKTELKSPTEETLSLWRLNAKQAETLCDPNLFSTGLLRQAEQMVSSSSVDFEKTLKSLSEDNLEHLAEVAFCFFGGFSSEAVTQVVFGGNREKAEEFFANSDVSKCLLKEEYEASRIYFAIPSIVRTILARDFQMEVRGENELDIKGDAEVDSILLLQEEEQNRKGKEEDIPSGPTLEEITHFVVSPEQATSEEVSEEDIDESAPLLGTEREAETGLGEIGEIGSVGELGEVGEGYRLLSEEPEVEVKGGGGEEEEEKHTGDTSPRLVELVKKSASYHISRLMELQQAYLTSSGTAFDVAVARILMERDNFSNLFMKLAALSKGKVVEEKSQELIELALKTVDLDLFFVDFFKPISVLFVYREIVKTLFPSLKMQKPLISSPLLISSYAVLQVLIRAESHLGLTYKAKIHNEFLIQSTLENYSKCLETLIHRARALVTYGRSKLHVDDHILASSLVAEGVKLVNNVDETSLSPELKYKLVSARLLAKAVMHRDVAGYTHNVPQYKSEVGKKRMTELKQQLDQIVSDWLSLPGDFNKGMSEQCKIASLVCQHRGGDLTSNALIDLLFASLKPFLRTRNLGAVVTSFAYTAKLLDMSTFYHLLSKLIDLIKKDYPTYEFGLLNILHALVIMHLKGINSTKTGVPNEGEFYGKILQGLDWCCEYIQQSPLEEDARLPSQLYEKYIIHEHLGNTLEQAKDLAAHISYCCDHPSLFSNRTVTRQFHGCVVALADIAPKSFKTYELFTRARDVLARVCRTEDNSPSSFFISHLQNTEAKLLNTFGIYHKPLGEKTKAVDYMHKSISVSQRTYQYIQKHRETYLKAISSVLSEEKGEEDGEGEGESSIYSETELASERAAAEEYLSTCLLDNRILQARVHYNIAATTTSVTDIEAALKFFEESWVFVYPASRPSVPQVGDTTQATELWKFKTWSLYLLAIQLKKDKDVRVLQRARMVLLETISISSVLKHDITNRNKTLQQVEKLLQTTPTPAPALVPAPSQAKTAPTKVPASAQQPKQTPTLAAVQQTPNSAPGVVKQGSSPAQGVVAKQAPTPAVVKQAPKQPPPSGPKIAVVTWMPDDAVSACCVCSVEFSLFRRKHHCRVCGRVVCDSCSPKILIPGEFGTNPERVCTTCGTRPLETSSTSSTSSFEGKK